MMDCNWLVKVAQADRRALRGLGVSAAEVAAMSHQEVIAGLKARGYSWKSATAESRQSIS